MLILLNITKSYDYKLLDQSIFLLLGPFVGIWTLIFGLKHINNFQNIVFKIDNLVIFLKNIKTNNINRFLVSYFFPHLTVSVSSFCFFESYLWFLPVTFVNIVSKYRWRKQKFPPLPQDMLAGFDHSFGQVLSRFLPRLLTRDKQ